MPHTADLTPTPEAVATTVRALVDASWPTTEAERRDWFLAHGLDMTATTRDGDSVTANDPHDWGDPTGGWHLRQGEFVGLHWFLWADEPWSTVVEPAAVALQESLSRLVGPPDEGDTASGPAIGFSALWTVGGRTIQLYAHGPHLDAAGEAREPFSAVQLHIDHGDRSDRKEQDARRRRPS